jgi:hypothetical protein
MDQVPIYNINNILIFKATDYIGGTGKSLVLSVIAAYVRSLGLICKICSATGLSASIFDDCSTLHRYIPDNIFYLTFIITNISLFKIPVVEECDKDYEDDSKLKLRLSKERLELLLATKVIIMDELLFLNRECVETVHNVPDLKGLKGKIIIGAG